MGNIPKVPDFTLNWNSIVYVPFSPLNLMIFILFAVDAILPSDELIVKLPIVSNVAPFFELTIAPDGIEYLHPRYNYENSYTTR